MSDTTPSCAIVWFREDLRLADNPALCAAVDSGRPVLALYVHDEEAAGDWAPGGAKKWWLHQNLAALCERLNERGVQLVLRRGEARTVVQDLVEETAAGAVYWNRMYEPWARERDAEIKAALKEAGVEAASFNGHLLREPWTVETKTGGPYKVYTPFWRAIGAESAEYELLDTPGEIGGWGGNAASENLDDWGFEPTKPDWAGGLRDTWTPGEAGARKRLDWFIENALSDYDEDRDFPGVDGTSMMSAYLHLGVISPRQIWMAISGRSGDGPSAFRGELGWREFSYHLLYHFPEFPDRNFQRKFDDFPWREDEDAFRAWTRGMTGYPIVDAGMRQLYEIGWMHNRVRMIVGSFLVKNLLLHWKRGEEWFWDTLVDADLASNSAGWQWVGGCGADAAPYFRIFNPITQGERFDKSGDYVRRWCPELKDLPDKFIQKPWEADAQTLERAGVELGRTYPRRIVDHKETRERALAAFDQIKDAA